MKRIIIRKYVLLLSLGFSLGILSGCTQIFSRNSNNILVDEQDFIIVQTTRKDTLSSLAAKYLHDSRYAQLIAELNDIEKITSGEEVIIPLKPYQPGGLQAQGYQTVPILLYHAFSPDKATDMIIKVEDFDAQMKYLKENNYQVITLDQLLSFMELKKQIPPKSVVLTFDDGWKSFHEYASPILKKYDFQATIFVYSDFIGGNSALSWQQLKELARKGHDIQCHSQTHRYLNRLKEGESFSDYFQNLEREILGPRELIKKKTKKECKYLAYPYGQTNNLVIALLKKNGFKGGLTSQRGYNAIDSDPYRLERSMIYGRNSLEDFKRSLNVFQQKDLR